MMSGKRGWKNVEIEKEKQEKYFFLDKIRIETMEKLLSDDERIAFASSKWLFRKVKVALLQDKNASLGRQKCHFELPI